jgi:hypothetical protein
MIVSPGTQNYSSMLIILGLFWEFIFKKQVPKQAAFAGMAIKRSSMG